VLAIDPYTPMRDGPGVWSLTRTSRPSAWSREKTIDWLLACTPNGRLTIEQEVDCCAQSIPVTVATLAPDSVAGR